MDASLPTGKEIGALRGTAAYQEEKSRARGVDPLMDTASKCPSVVNRSLHEHQREIQHES